MEVEEEALALETTRGSKQEQASAAPEEELAAGKKTAEAEVMAAGNKASSAEEEAKSSAAGATATKKKKTMLVKVSDARIKYLLAHPPNLTLSDRLRSFTKETCPCYEVDPSVLDDYPVVADLIDKWNAPKLDILRQFQQSGVAFEEIEADDEDN